MLRCRRHKWSEKELRMNTAMAVLRSRLRTVRLPRTANGCTKKFNALADETAKELRVKAALLKGQAVFHGLLDEFKDRGGWSGILPAEKPRITARTIWMHPSVMDHLSSMKEDEGLEWTPEKIRNLNDLATRVGQEG